MAIIIQEEKNKSGLMVAIVALAVLAAGGLTYYLFFSPAPLAERIVGSSKFQRISRLANIRIDVDQITGSDVWKSLTRPEPVPPIDPKLPSRRSNPFESF